MNTQSTSPRMHQQHESRSGDQRLTCFSMPELSNDEMPRDDKSIERFDQLSCQSAGHMDTTCVLLGGRLQSAAHMNTTLPPCHMCVVGGEASISWSHEHNTATQSQACCGGAFQSVGYMDITLPPRHKCVVGARFNQLVTWTQHCHPITSVFCGVRGPLLNIYATPLCM